MEYISNLQIFIKAPHSEEIPVLITKISLATVYMHTGYMRPHKTMHGTSKNRILFTFSDGKRIPIYVNTITAFRLNKKEEIFFAKYSNQKCPIRLSNLLRQLKYKALVEEEKKAKEALETNEFVMWPYYNINFLSPHKMSDEYMSSTTSSTSFIYDEH